MQSRSGGNLIFLHILLDPVPSYILDHCQPCIETYVSSIVLFGACDACPNFSLAAPAPAAVHTACFS